MTTRTRARLAFALFLILAAILAAEALFLFTHGA